MHNTKKAGNVIALLTTTAVLAAWSMPSQAETIKLTFASGFPPVIQSTATLIDTFLPGVNAELEAMGSENRVEWNVAVAGALAGLPAILDVTRDGIADVSELGAIFEPNRLPLSNVAYVAPFVTPDHRLATLSVDGLIKSMPAMAEEWSSHNLHYLTGFAIDNYVLMSKTPIDSVDDLNGKKVGVAGINTNWLNGTGAVGVITSFGTAYNDMQTGVFEATIIPMVGGASIKLNEVAPYAVRVKFGSMFQGGLVVNKDRWNSLPEDVQTAMTASAAKFQARYLDVLDTAIVKAEEAYQAAGGTLLDFPEEERVKWANNLTGATANWVSGLKDMGLPADEVLAGFMDYQRGHDAPIVVQWDKIGAADE